MNVDPYKAMQAANEPADATSPFEAFVNVMDQIAGDAGNDKE